VRCRTAAPGTRCRARAIAGLDRDAHRERVDAGVERLRRPGPAAGELAVCRRPENTQRHHSAGAPGVDREARHCAVERNLQLGVGGTRERQEGGVPAQRDVPGWIPGHAAERDGWVRRAGATVSACARLERPVTHPPEYRGGSAGSHRGDTSKFWSRNVRDRLRLAGGGYGGVRVHGSIARVRGARAGALWTLR
jgi:hypothetical protein